MESVLKYIFGCILICALVVGLVYGSKGINRLEKTKGFFSKSWIVYTLAILLCVLFFVLSIKMVLLFPSLFE